MVRTTIVRPCHIKQNATMKKILIFITLVVLGVVNATAIPAKSILKNITQPDGSTVSVRLVGDEFAHFVLSVDSILLQEAANGGYFYATMENGRLIPTDMLAHNPDERRNREIKYVEGRKYAKTDSLFLNMIGQKHETLLIKANANRLNGISRALGVPTRYVGNKKGLVILVNFANLSMVSETAHEDFDRMFNE